MMPGIGQSTHLAVVGTLQGFEEVTLHRQLIVLINEWQQQLSSASERGKQTQVYATDYAKIFVYYINQDDIPHTHAQTLTLVMKL